MTVALRTLLQERADEIADERLAARIPAVHRRVRAARRRRAGLVAASVAAVYAVALSAVQLGETSPGPSGEATLPRPPAEVNLTTSVAGWPVSPTAEFRGRTYVNTAAAESEPGRRRLVLRLPASDERRIVAWGSSSSDQRAFMTMRINGRLLSRGTPGFDCYGRIEPGSPAVLTLRQSAVDPGDLLGIVVFEDVDGGEESAGG
ncbi:MAG TPA: hypothetical protein VLA97_16460 [Nocardioidaceae bacterium]|nr:hypothetical protein [Nocardioidaceae bacterium]